MTKLSSLCLFLVLATATVSAQRSRSKNLVYVDGKGVLRYTKDKTEADFFGVNYTVPFAYGYRSHNALGVDIEKAIDADVYHMARLGLDAFRVHVWDVEISDSLGNVINNEHLRLFDYLLKKLKENNIKILITPIAFWGNGYPERDVRTTGFSYVYTKGGAVVKEEAFKAQENYLKQFFTHVNPYTRLTYKDDPDVIAMEINNEPHHSGPKERTTEYINRMAAAVRSTGWTKPVFYNISESPTYADAVVKAKVDGHSFQWYPTGLVAGHEQRGNFLPNVDVYRIPFLDTIPAFKTRARMVYEFDAGDVLQPIMYPAMARSFRTAGMQWATQFAYDPVSTAYANTEYQTHYLNLSYTPAKAISLLIASKAFHRLPRGKSYGTFPADTLFDVFRVSYQQQLSEMNSEEEFYYSGSTATQPKSLAKLKHIAGVGSSPVVKYEGTGAYFLDRLSDGSWIMEIIPDAIAVNDPFEKASLKKAVVSIHRQANRIELALPDIHGFTIEGINNGNNFKQVITKDGLKLEPGKYHIAKPEGEFVSHVHNPLEFYQPTKDANDSTFVIRSLPEVTPNKSFPISANIVVIDSAAKVSVEIRNSSNRWRTIPMQRSSGYDYNAHVPADMVTPGVINYRVLVRKGDGETYTFPGNVKGDPYAWDNYHSDSYQTMIAAPSSPLELFKPLTDRNKIVLYNPDWRRNTVDYITTQTPGALALKATMTDPQRDSLMGFQIFFADKIRGRQSESSSFKKLVVRARATQPTNAAVSLMTSGGVAFGASISFTPEWKSIEVPLAALQPASYLLLPRPYPGFQPLRFFATSKIALNPAELEQLQISFGNGASSPLSIEVEWVRLEQ